MNLSGHPILRNSRWLPFHIFNYKSSYEDVTYFPLASGYAAASLRYIFTGTPYSREVGQEKQQEIPAN